jgi:hypothetical protein
LVRHHVDIERLHSNSCVLRFLLGHPERSEGPLISRQDFQTTLNHRRFVDLQLIAVNADSNS